MFCISSHFTSYFLCITLCFVCCTFLSISYWQHSLYVRLYIQRVYSTNPGLLLQMQILTTAPTKAKSMTNTTTNTNINTNTNTNTNTKGLFHKSEITLTNAKKPTHQQRPVLIWWQTVIVQCSYRVPYIISYIVSYMESQEQR